MLKLFFICGNFFFCLFIFHFEAKCEFCILKYFLQAYTYFNLMQLCFLKEREMTIAHLKAELFEVSGFNI